MFGLTHSDGNHGEDVKEYYFYLDSTPTHSYMKYLYKYPHAAFPYDDLVDTNRKRGRHDLEYELLDTGVFEQNRYFDVFVEYAKATAEDILIEITVANRGREPAVVHVLPTLWFRNVWSCDDAMAQPAIKQIDGSAAIVASHSDLGDRFLCADGHPEWLFTDNETNTERLFRAANRAPFVKEGINELAQVSEHAGQSASRDEECGIDASAKHDHEDDDGDDCGQPVVHGSSPERDATGEQQPDRDGSQAPLNRRHPPPLFETNPEASCDEDERGGRREKRDDRGDGSRKTADPFSDRRDHHHVRSRRHLPRAVQVIEL